MRAVGAQQELVKLHGEYHAQIPWGGGCSPFTTLRPLKHTHIHTHTHIQTRTHTHTHIHARSFRLARATCRADGKIDHVLSVVLLLCLYIVYGYPPELTPRSLPEYALAGIAFPLQIRIC